MKFKEQDNIIFKQRTARHLAFRKLAWEYENGHVLSVNHAKKTVDVCWLQGHHSRNDTVPYDDIVAIYDESAPHIKIGAFSGCSRILHKIVKEGSSK